MTTLTLRLQLDEHLAMAYKKATSDEKEDIKRLFERLIDNRFRKQAIEDMIQRMDALGKVAEDNGLTEELIDEILAEYN